MRRLPASTDTRPVPGARIVTACPRRDSASASASTARPTSSPGGNAWGDTSAMRSTGASMPPPA